MWPQNSELEQEHTPVRTSVCLTDLGSDRGRTWLDAMIMRGMKGREKRTKPRHKNAYEQRRDQRRGRWTQSRLRRILGPCVTSTVTLEATLLLKMSHFSSKLNVKLPCFWDVGVDPAYVTEAEQSDVTKTQQTLANICKLSPALINHDSEKFQSNSHKQGQNLLPHRYCTYKYQITKSPSLNTVLLHPAEAQIRWCFMEARCRVRLEAPFDRGPSCKH